MNRDLRVVGVPRAVLAKWANQPWSVLVDAATRGEEGLVLRDSMRFRYRGDWPTAATVANWTAEQQERWAEDTDVAYFRDASDWGPDRASLLEQHW